MKEVRDTGLLNDNEIHATMAREGASSSQVLLNMLLLRQALIGKLDINRACGRS